MEARTEFPAQAESIVIPAHRDPEEYLRWIRERQRTAEPSAEPAPATLESSERRPRTGRRVLALALGLLALVAVGRFALDRIGADDVLAAPSDVSPVVATTPTPITTPVRMAQVMALADEEPQVYEVKVGDTLLEIAAAHGTTVDALMEVNGLTDADRLVPGMQLHVPLASSNSQTR